MQITWPQRSNLLRCIGWLPGRPAILKRLIAVFEQMRNTGKAAAFLRAYQKAVPDDPWATSKAEQFWALGLA
jgi:eukaryotic-like serine/threonine-protein kinase